MTHTNIPVFEHKGFLYGLHKQFRVVSALVTRETRTRFSNRRFGFLWLFFEPLAFIGMFVAVHSFVRGSVPYGDDAMIFVITGILPLRMFKGIESSCMSAISSNKALMSYPVVKPIDTLLARLILQFVIMTLITGSVVIALGYYLDRQMIYHTQQLFTGILALSYLAFAIGFFSAVVSALFASFASIHGIVMGLPLMLTSGLFFVPALMPPAIQNVIYWNPVLHAVEWFRGAFYLDYMTMLDVTYMMTFATVALAFSLVMERQQRGKFER